MSPQTQATLDIIVTVLVVVTMAGFVSFVALYARYTTWWKDELGQAFMGALGMVALFLVLALVFRVFPEWGGWPYFRLVCWTLIAIVAVRLPWVFLKTRAADRRPRNPEKDGTK